jgi:hypothetical protein
MARATVPDDLHHRRLLRWRQTLESRIADSDEGIDLINRVGVATLYPASAEIPDLFHAYMGDPEAKTQPQWDSPSGIVYGWRWTIGRRQGAFYGVIAHNRPTFVSWPLLPAILRLRGEQHTPDELFDLGRISANAYRIAQVLEEAGGTLTTGDLRERAGFPSGREQRAAYLKALDELDRRLLLAKVFTAGEDDLSHALIYLQYPEQQAAADALAAEDAYDQLLRAYLSNAVYALPAPLARHLKLPEAELRAALDRLVAADAAERVGAPGDRATYYTWRE